MKTCILILLVGFILFFDSPDIKAQQETLLLTNHDRADIIKQTLTTEITRHKKEEYRYRELPKGDLEMILSLENIQPDLVPKIQDVKFILLKHEEIREKIERTREFLTPGVRYLAFSEFKVKGSKVIVSLDNTYISKKVPAYFEEGWDLSDGGLFHGGGGVMAGPFESDNCVILKPRGKRYVVVDCLEGQREE